MTPVRVKICGLTRLDDAQLAGRIDVDAIGVVLWPGSPRCVDLATARALCRAVPPWTARVGVFVSPSVDEVRRTVAATGLGVVQVHGVADADPYRALGLPILWATGLADDAPDPVAPEGTTLLLDTHDPVRHGGTGQTVDWTRAKAIARRERHVILAGGLTADNVTQAIETVRPYGVDVSSGVEAAPGIKSAERMQAFVAAARRNLHETHR
jgi:phosphoribosylanthranilate isomerase